MLSQFQPRQERARQAGRHGELFLRQTTAGSQSLELFAETLNRAQSTSGTKAGDNEMSLHRPLCRAKGWNERNSRTIQTASLRQAASRIKRGRFEMADPTSWYRIGFTTRNNNHEKQAAY